MDRSRRAVRETYDRIAAHFAQTREHPWADVRAFIEAGHHVGTALDLGCGNGRHAELLAERADRVVGADLSRGTLATARERAAERGFPLELVQCDAGTLPFAAASIDRAVYIAALHHLPTRAARVGSLDELARVLAPDAEALVSVWSTDHDAFEETAGFDTLVDWTLPDGETVERFYHIYDPAEFEGDLAASACVVVETFVSYGNCYAVVRGEGKRS